MKRYKTREGVVLTNVCGEALLVSASVLHDVCPFVTILNESSAFLWVQLQKGASQEELEKAVMSEYEVEDPALVKMVIRDFIRQMLDLHYLLDDVTSSADE